MKKLFTFLLFYLLLAVSAKAEIFYTPIGSSGGGGGGGSPAGSSGQVQYNNSGSFGGTSLLTIGTTVQATAPVWIGTTAINDTGVLLQATSSVAGYNQLIVQNTSNATNASANVLVQNNSGTSTTYYGEFGMNSSAFTGTGSFNKANAVYLDSQSGDLSIGTLTNNTIHFVQNNSATDALTIGTSGITLGTSISLGTATLSGQVNYAVREVTSGTTDTATLADNQININRLAGSGAFTETIPACSSTNNGYQVIINDEAGVAQTENITVTPASGTINNLSTLLMNNRYQQTTLTCDGTNTNYTATSRMAQQYAPFIYNLQPSVNLQYWRAALSKAQSGNGNALLGFIGDSTVYGFYSNNTSSGNYHLLSPLVQLAKYFSPQFTASADDWMGTAGSGQNYNGIYTGSLLSMGSGWSAAGSAFTTGGSFYTASSTTGNLATTPLGVVDTFVIGYAKLSGGGSFSYNIDGGSNTTVSTNNGSNAAGFTTVTASSPGNHTLNINWVSGTVYVGLVYAYNSANKNVIFLNGGWGGSTTCNNWDNSATSPYGPIGMMAAISPAVTMIDLGINDWGVNTVASVKTCLQDIITKSAGNVILVTPFPSATSVATVSVQQQYINMYYQLADANNIPLIDQYNMFVSNANAVTYGFDYDTKHPNGVGYADESRLLATALLAP